MTYPNAIVAAVALISGSFLLSRIADSQQIADAPATPVLNIALAHAVEETTAMHERASWVWVMYGNELYTCRKELDAGDITDVKSAPVCSNPAEVGQ